MNETLLKAVNFLMKLEDQLTERERDELMEILTKAQEVLPPELLEALTSIQAELFKQLKEADEDGLTTSYLRDL